MASTNSPTKEQDTHITRVSDSSHFDYICVLCGADDGSTQGIAALKARCPIGGSLRHDSHSIVYDYDLRFGKNAAQYPIRCGLCAKRNLIDLQGPCAVMASYTKPAVCEEVGTAVPEEEDEFLKTWDLAGETISNPVPLETLATVSKAATEVLNTIVGQRTVKMTVDAGAPPELVVAATRNWLTNNGHDPNKLGMPDGSRGHPGHLSLYGTPYGDIAGTVDAVKYVMEIVEEFKVNEEIKKSLGPQDHSLRGELKTILNRHSMDSRTNTPDFVLADLVLAFLSNLETMLAKRDSWHSDLIRPSVNPDLIPLSEKDA